MSADDFDAACVALLAAIDSIVADLERRAGSEAVADVRARLDVVRAKFSARRMPASAFGVAVCDESAFD